MVEIAKIPAGSKVLDVATGRGVLLFPAAEAVGQDGQVIGVDLSETMIQETSRHDIHYTFFSPESSKIRLNLTIFDGLNM